MAGKTEKNDANVVNALKKLMWCKVSNLRIMNGRTLGYSSGHCTGFQYNGKSTIAYVISGEHLINLISNSIGILSHSCFRPCIYYIHNDSTPY